MIKGLKYYVLLIILMLFVPLVNAEECSNAEKVSLGKEALSVKINYVEAQKAFKSDEIYPPDGHENDENYVAYYNYFKINFYNITENISVELENKDTKEKITIDYKDTNEGFFQYDYYDINEVTKFNYTIYASYRTNCSREVLKNGDLNLPAFNPYHEYAKCKLLDNFPLCKKYLNTNITYEKFMTEIDKALEKKENKKNQNTKKEDGFIVAIKKFIEENKTTVLIGSIVFVVIIGIVVVVVIRKKRRRVI